MGRKKKYETDEAKRIAVCVSRMKYYYRKKAKGVVRGVDEMRTLYDEQSNFKYTSEQLIDRILEQVQKMISYAVDGRERSVVWNCLITNDNPKPNMPQITYRLDITEIEMVKDILIKQGYNVEINHWGKNKTGDVIAFMSIWGWATSVEPIKDTTQKVFV